MRILVVGLVVAVSSPGVLGDESIRPISFQSPSDVVLDSGDSGTIRALGRDWKMTFDRSGATFIPCLGDRAPRNFGVHFDLGSGAVPVLDGQRVTFDRGAFTEVYDLSPQSVEQSFVFAQRPHDGDLALRLPIVTELDSTQHDGHGLEFLAPGIGGVRYGDATLVDAEGRRLEVPSTRMSGAIEITIPDAFLDGAKFPLVVDPTISTFSVDGSTGVDQNSDAVFSPSASSYAVAYERANSILDHDILVRRFTSSGAIIAAHVIDASSANTRAPAIAERLGIAVVVFSRTGIQAGIKARRLDLITGFVGSTFDVSPGVTSNAAIPDIGSTEAAVARPYLVVWRQSDGNGSTEIAACTMNDTGSNLSVFPQVCSDLLAQDEPCVSPRAAAGSAWVIAHSGDSGSTPPSRKIVACLYSTTGVAIGALSVAPGSSTNDTHPKVCSGDGNFALVAWIATPSTGDSDVMAARLNLFAPTGTSAVNVSGLDHEAGDSVDQSDVDIGFDGDRFVIGYAEPKPSTSDLDVRASIWKQNGAIPVLIVPSTPIATTAAGENGVCVAGADSGSTKVTYISWTELASSGNGNDIEAAIFSPLATDGSTTVQTGCGSPEPIFLTSTPVIVGGSITLTQIGGNSPLLFLGTPASVPLCPGQAPGCILGVAPILVTPMPPSITTTVPADGALVGVTFAMQILDVVPLSTPGAICGPPKFSQKVRVSDTRIVTIQ